MRRAFVTLLFSILVLVLSTGCSSTERKPSIEKLLVGRWMLDEVDGKKVPTNDKVVYRFRYDKALTASQLISSEKESWMMNLELACTLRGNSLSIDVKTDEQLSIVYDHVILRITENELECITTVKTRREGRSASMSEKRREKYVRVPVDFRSSVIGVWEGRLTSESSEYDSDGAEHRWEFWKDGSYVYYDRNEDGTWNQSVNRYSDFIVDGRLLFMRWANQDRVEKRECWEIESAKNGVMKWTALRRREDGSTYTASFTMNRVTK